MRSGYSVADLTTTGLEVGVVGPLTAGYLAFRLPPFLKTLSVGRPVLPPVRVLVRSWSLLVLGAPLAGVVAMISAARILPEEPVAWAVIGVAFLAVLACAALGALA